MKRLQSWLTALLIAAVSLINPVGAPAEETTDTPPATQADVLTLKQAIDTALANNYSVRIAAQQVRRAQGQIAEAGSGRMLQLDASVTHMRSGPASEISFPGPGGEETIEISVTENTRTRIGAALPVDISGRIKSAIKAAQFGLLAEEFALAAAEQDVSMQVQEAYLGVLRTQALAQVAEESVAAAQEHLRIAKVNFDAGTVAYFDVLRAEVELANYTQRLVEAKNAVELATAGLNFVMGVDVNLPQQLAEPAKVAPVAPPPLETSQQEAESLRPELLGAFVQRRAAEKGIDLAKAGYLPSLVIAGGQNYDTETSGFGGQDETWDISAAFSIPIFDGGATRGRVQQARAGAEAALEAERLTREQVRLEVRQAHLQMREARERIGVAEKNVEQAREAFRLAQLRYQSGISPSIEVTDAELALAQSRVNEVNAYYDYLLAYTRLKKAVGQPLFTAQDIQPAPKNG